MSAELPACLYATEAITGLSSALHLAERGVAVTGLDAHAPGWGASGRNGGQVNPGLKQEPDAIERRFGPALGGRMVALACEAPAADLAMPVTALRPIPLHGFWRVGAGSCLALGRLRRSTALRRRG